MHNARTVQDFDESAPLIEIIAHAFVFIWVPHNTFVRRCIAFHNKLQTDKHFILIANNLKTAAVKSFRIG